MGDGGGGRVLSPCKNDGDARRGTVTIFIPQITDNWYLLGVKITFGLHPENEIQVPFKVSSKLYDEHPWHFYRGSPNIYGLFYL